MTSQRQMASVSFLTPRRRRHRFSEAVRDGYKVLPFWPGDAPSLPQYITDIISPSACEESLWYLDEGDAEVSFPVGEINSATVLEVSSEAGQEWLDTLDVWDTPQFWTPEARYYLFRHVQTAELPPPNKLLPGLRLLNDGDMIIYPGSMAHGQLVHWEIEPYYAAPMPLPCEIWPD